MYPKGFFGKKSIRVWQPVKDYNFAKIVILGHLCYFNSSTTKIFKNQNLIILLVAPVDRLNLKKYFLHIDDDALERH